MEFEVVVMIVTDDGAWFYGNDEIDFIIIIKLWLG
jgi:hypothetical protein